MRDALASEVEVREVFLAEGLQDDSLEEALAARALSPLVVGDEVIGALSETVTPQGVVAVVADPSVGLEALAAADLCLVLADVRDPGNAGTLVRTAAAAGAGAVVFPTGTVDPLHPKVVRSAAGALFRVPLVRGRDLEDVAAALRSAGTTLLGAAAGARHTMYEADLTRPTAFVLGNESWGLPPPADAFVDARVSIPMPGPVESLNVSIAGAVLLFEAVRQRRSLQGAGLSSASDE